MLEESLDLVVVGDLPVDHLWVGPGWLTRPGGASYSAVAAAALGKRVGVLGDVGDDQAEGFLPRLSELGADVQGVELLTGPGLSYSIHNGDETVPQQVGVHGWRFRRQRSHAIPSHYERTKALLIYPYDLSILRRLVPQVRKNGGRILFDLQHDISNLQVWAELVSQCDIVLASRRELLVYIAQESESSAVEKLQRLGARQVVVKYGSGGSAIYGLEREPIRIPAFLSNFQCTIGAGDVYNAIYTISLGEGLEPESAGHRASVAASVFTEHLRFEDYVPALSRLDFDRERRHRIAVIAPPERLSASNLYLAGHFLSVPLRAWVDRVTLAFESRGFPVFSPHRDAGILTADSDESTRRMCFLRDVEALRRAKAIIALLDGVGRGGTSWEMGYEFSRDVPIFGLCTGPEQPLSNMVRQSCYSIVASLPQLLNEIFAYFGQIEKGA